MLRLATMSISKLPALAIAVPTCVRSLSGAASHAGRICSILRAPDSEISTSKSAALAFAAHPEKETFFSRIVRGEVPTSMVYEDDQCMAFRDIAPVAPVHILVRSAADARVCLWGGMCGSRLAQ